MNVPRLLEIALWLANGAKHSKIVFDMSKGVKLEEAAFDKKDLSACQTSCCIAGAATQFFDKTWIDTLIAERLSTGDLNADASEVPFYGSKGVFSQAQELLDLDDEQAENLFIPGGCFGTRFAEYNDPDWAARTICHLIATGVADWEATRNNPDI